MLLECPTLLTLDFNYTASVKYILSECGMGKDEISTRLIKIHGEAEKNNIIFGVEDKANIKREHVFLKKAYNLAYASINFSELFENIKDSFIFGHSLGETDHTYFKDHFLQSCSYIKQKNKFAIYYYDDNAHYEIMKQIDDLTMQNLSSFKQNSTVRLIKIN